ncbi:MAG: hypothetical protein K2N80_04100 [Lachnospiraceae bacterium]|nr:hypothetical protein [Lachnospiraceae bacterium]
MTAYELQKDIAGEVERILQCMLLKDVKGNTGHLKAYAQALPKRTQNIRDYEEAGAAPDVSVISDEDIVLDEDVIINEILEDDPYPYCIIMVNSGEIQPSQNVHEVQITLVFGIFDDDKECQGHQVIMNMIHKVAERFIKNPYLKEKYRLNHDAGIKWILGDDDQYPYYFGAVEMTWDTFFVRLEDDKYV